MSDASIRLIGLILGWGLVGVGALGVLLALFRDRSRGRRRCPRCWYSMDGAPEPKCPECGRAIRTERSLFRTRRRWRRAVATTLISLLGLGVLYTQGAVRFGWTKAIPSPILVAFTPIHVGDWDGRRGTSTLSWYGELKKEAGEELRRRVHAGELADWEALLLIRRLRIAAAANNRNLDIFDAGDLDTDLGWIPEQGRTPPVRPAPHQQLAALADRFPLTNNESFAHALTRILASDRIVVLTGPAPNYQDLVYPIGPKLVVWDASRAAELKQLLEAIRRPQTPRATGAVAAPPERPAKMTSEAGLETYRLGWDPWDDWKTHVYDARPILARRLSGDPRLQLEHAEQQLLEEAFPDSNALRISFNGRIIVTANPAEHDRVEAYLASLRENEK